ncbi:MAG: DinB family protein [Melioribacteraceae bacterium]
MNAVIEKLVAELDNAVNGDPWFGASLKTILSDISCEQAVIKYTENIHSIAEITHHICGWIEEVLSRIEGNEPKDPARGDWKEIANLAEVEWSNLMSSLFTAHTNLISRMKIFPFEKFEVQVGKEKIKELGTGISYREMLVGLMEHNIYHGGQIALIKKLLEI